jgi:hypothetical protein
MFRFAQVLVLIVAIAWIIELTCCYLKQRRGEHQRAFDHTLGVGAGTRYRVSEAQLAMGLESADGNRDAPDGPGGDNCVVPVHKLGKLGWLAARIAVKMSGLQMSTPGSYRISTLFGLIIRGKAPAAAHGMTARLEIGLTFA